MSYFDATYVINLDAATGRLERVTRRCQSLGIQCTRFPGVNGRELTREELITEATPECRSNCTPAMLGCGLSHIRLWKHALQKKHKRVLIIEDDVEFKTELFWPTMRAALEEVPKDFDILLLGCFGLCDADNTDRSFTQTLLRLNLNRASLNTNTFRSEHVYSPEFFSGTHAYIVSEQGLRKLLRVIPRVDKHIDWSMAEAHEHINIYAIDPAIAHQESMMESTTATYGFPGTVNALLSRVRDQYNIELAYYLNVGSRRIGSLTTNVQLNRWHTILFCIGLAGLPWHYFLLFAILDVGIVTPASLLDVTAKSGSYAAGLAMHYGITHAVSTLAK